MAPGDAESRNPVGGLRSRDYNERAIESPDPLSQGETRTGRHTKSYAALLAFALVALGPGAASSGNAHVAWDRCWPDGATLETFACDRDDGPAHDLVVSFRLDQDMPDFYAVDVIINFWAASDTLSDWWRFAHSGGCRTQALSVNTDFAGLPPGACADSWLGKATLGGWEAASGLPGTPTYPGAGWVEAILAESHVQVAQSLSAGTEYYAVTFRIGNQKTTGAGACAGCDEDICILLQSLQVSGFTREETCLYSGTGSEYDAGAIGWQCGEEHWIRGFYGGTVFGCGHSSDCVVGARRSTWGSIKSLYR